MQREVYDLKLVLHLRVQRNPPGSSEDAFSQLDRHSSAIKAALDLYKGTHAARTHPVCSGC